MNHDYIVSLIVLSAKFYEVLHGIHLTIHSSIMEWRCSSSLCTKRLIHYSLCDHVTERTNISNQYIDITYIGFLIVLSAKFCEVLHGIHLTVLSSSMKWCYSILCAT
jgi:hypothetical protein